MSSGISHYTPVLSDSSVNNSSGGISTTPAQLSEPDSDNDVESCPDSPHLSVNISMPRPSYASNYQGHILSAMDDPTTFTEPTLMVQAGLDLFQPIVNLPEMYNVTVPDGNLDLTLLPGIEHWDEKFFDEFSAFFASESNGGLFSSCSSLSSEQSLFFGLPETDQDFPNLTSGFDCSTSSDLLSSSSTHFLTETVCDLLWSPCGSSCPCVSFNWVDISKQIGPMIPEGMEEIDVPVEMNRLKNGKEIWIEPIRTTLTPNVMGVPMQDCLVTCGMCDPWKSVKIRPDQWKVDEFGNRKLPLKITWPGYSSREYLLDLKARHTIADLASQIASQYQEAMQTLTTAVTCPTNPWHLQSDWITFESLRLVGLFEVEGGFQARVTILRPRALGDVIQPATSPK